MTITRLSDVTVGFSLAEMPSRLDINYLNPQKLSAVQRLESITGETVLLSTVLSDKPTTGKTPRTADYVASGKGIPILKVANLSDSFIVEWKPLAYAPQASYDSSVKGRVKLDDILLLCAAHHSGYIGLNTSIVADIPFAKALHVGELIRLRVDKDEIDPYYLTVLLNHEVVRSQLRNTTRGVTIHLYPQDIGEITILKPERLIQEQIGNKLRESHHCRVRAAQAMIEAQIIFSRYINISHSGKIVSFDYTQQDCENHARLDPRFYDVKYQPFLGLVSDTSKKFSALADISIEPIHRGVQPEYADATGAINVLKTVDVQNRKVDWKNCRKVTLDFFKQHPKGQLYRDDIVLTSTGEGSWGRAAICDSERALADSHLTILRVNRNDIDPYAVLAFLWSEYGQMQFEQRVRGSTGQTEIYPQDIKKIKVLIPSEGDQKIIRSKIKKQFKLLEQAEQLRQEAIQDIEHLLGGEAPNERR